MKVQLSTTGVFGKIDFWGMLFYTSPHPLWLELFGRHQVRPPNAPCTSLLAKQLGALEGNLVFLSYPALGRSCTAGRLQHEF